MPSGQYKEVPATSIKKNMQKYKIKEKEIKYREKGGREGKSFFFNFVFFNKKLEFFYDELQNITHQAGFDTRRRSRSFHFPSELSKRVHKFFSN